MLYAMHFIVNEIKDLLMKQVEDLQLFVTLLYIFAMLIKMLISLYSTVFE